MPDILRKLSDAVLRKTESLRFSDEGNRSIVRLDYRLFLRDPHLLRLVTEYRATGYFTGHLTELSAEDAHFVAQIKTGLQALTRMQERYTAGAMWAKLNQQMLSSALAADPRCFNHIGALCYKTFRPLVMGMEAVIREVIKILVIYDHLRPQVRQFEGLFVNLNSPYFTLEGQRLNPGIRAIEESMTALEALGTKPRRVLEIGGGSGQLAHMFLRGGAKVVVIDLPGMHSRAPFFLYKAGYRVCTYDRYLQAEGDLEGLLRDHDLIYLPPWEAESLKTQFDLAVNVHSLGEMSVEETVRYLKLIDRTCDAFFSLNTNTQGLDRAKQPAYAENSSLEYSKHLSLKPVASGTTIADTVLQKILHNGYVLYKKQKAGFPASAEKIAAQAKPTSLTTS